MTSALDEFWRQVAQDGSPIIEPVPGDDSHVLATFVWRGGADTRSVIVAARFNGADPQTDPRNRVHRVPGTNIWAVTHLFPADAEVQYQLCVNAPASGAGQPGSAFQRYAKPDPLNPLTYPEKDDALYDASQPWRIGSIARMPGVRENPWLVRKDGIARGIITMRQQRRARVACATVRAVAHTQRQVLSRGGADGRPHVAGFRCHAAVVQPATAGMCSVPRATMFTTARCLPITTRCTGAAPCRTH